MCSADCRMTGRTFVMAGISFLQYEIWRCADCVHGQQFKWSPPVQQLVSSYRNCLCSLFTYNFISVLTVKRCNRNILQIYSISKAVQQLVNCLGLWFWSLPLLGEWDNGFLFSPESRLNPQSHLDWEHKRRGDADVYERQESGLLAQREKNEEAEFSGVCRHVQVSEIPLHEQLKIEQLNVALLTPSHQSKWNDRHHTHTVEVQSKR